MRAKALLVMFALAASPLTAQELQPWYDGGPMAPVSPVWSYSLKGDAAIRPSRVIDDGARTFIEFPPEVALPAVFAIGASGEEELVNGYMRGDAFVIDRVWQELVFRLDKQRVTARRSASPAPPGD